MAGSARKNTQWTVTQVETLLCVVGNQRTQKELDGVTRNEKVYKEIPKKLAEGVFHRTYQQKFDQKV